MQGKHLRLFASDKELYDLMFSSKKRITYRVLHQLSRERGVFFGPDTSRADLANYISTTIHDLEDVIDLVKDAEPGTRRERTSSITVKMQLSPSEIQDVIQEYANTEGESEEVKIPLKRKDAIVASVAYSEFDLSRTTLAQRQDKVATLDFKIGDDGVVIRFPGSDKGRELVESLIEKLERKKKTAIPQEHISVEDLTPRERTRFFVKIVGNMAGYKVDTVTRLKVSSKMLDSEDIDVDENEEEESVEKEEVEKALAHLVENVALTGSDLLVSKQYRQMEEDGFFITAIKWTATQTEHPFDKVEFEALFEGAQQGTGFQYRARHSRVSVRTGTHPQNFKLPDDATRKALFSRLETTAKNVLAEIRRERSPSKGNG
ncbi:hypothetical protein [Martelella soudanensis]|uniref:hypothetical protein n=1 Tax=unclassified Martelella TaxID=2629616 RepID=UPI0015E0278A|nr:MULTISPECIES: hypothetical protein [unclassified Martelella]